MNPRRIALFSGVLVLAGCMVGPDYQRPAFDLPASYPVPESASQAAVPPQWWKLYGDETLDALISSALERNADIRVAVARIEESDASLREVGAAFLPEVDFGGAPTRSRISTTTATPLPPGISPVRNNIRMTVSTAFEIDFWGKLRRTIEAARALAIGSRYAKDVVAISLAGLTAQAYFSLRSLDSQITATRQTLATRDEYLAMVRRRAAGGIASDLDVNQALVARSDASVQLRDLARQRALVEHQLATLTGRLDLGSPAPGSLMNLPVPPKPPAGLPSALLERRPDIRQAEQLLVAANAQIGVARAAMLPTISLTGLFGNESSGLSTLLRSPSEIWSLGFGLTLPIFDWGRLAARSEAAVARAHQSVAGYQRAIETGFREVSDALTNLAQTTAKEEDLQIRAAAARDALRLAGSRYEAGYSPYLEVLDAQRTENDAQLALVRNRQNRLAASVDLMKALGGGWSAPQ